MTHKILPSANILRYRDQSPKLEGTVFIASGAQIIGDVTIGDQSSIWFNTVLRGDCNWIRVGARTNIQDGSVVHVTQTTAPTTIGSDVTIGHGAIIHGCTIEDLCLIGMGAIILDGATIPTRSMVAAGSVVSPGKTFPSGWLIMGAPAKPVRELRTEELGYLERSVQHYLDYQNHYSSPYESEILKR